jgi:hypothetical protein
MNNYTICPFPCQGKTAGGFSQKYTGRPERRLFNTIQRCNAYKHYFIGPWALQRPTCGYCSSSSLKNSTKRFPNRCVPSLYLRIHLSALHKGGRCAFFSSKAFALQPGLPRRSWTLLSRLSPLRSQTWIQKRCELPSGMPLALHSAAPVTAARYPGTNGVFLREGLQTSIQPRMPCSLWARKTDASSAGVSASIPREFRYAG